MLLERFCEYHEREFGHAVHACCACIAFRFSLRAPPVLSLVFRRCRRGCGLLSGGLRDNTLTPLKINLRPNITRTTRNHNPHIPIRRLRPNRRGQNTQQMKIRKIIHLPLLIQPVRRESRFSVPRGLDCVCAEDNHVQSSRRSVVDPFRCEFAYGV